MLRRDAREDTRGACRLAPTPLPVAQGGRADPKRGRERFVAETQFEPDRTHRLRIDAVHAHSGVPATPEMGSGLAGALEEIPEIGFFMRTLL